MLLFAKMVKKDAGALLSAWKALMVRTLPRLAENTKQEVFMRFAKKESGKMMQVLISPSGEIYGLKELYIDSIDIGGVVSKIPSGSSIGHGYVQVDGPSGEFLGAAQYNFLLHNFSINFYSYQTEDFLRDLFPIAIGKINGPKMTITGIRFTKSKPPESSVKTIGEQAGWLQAPIKPHQAGCDCGGYLVGGFHANWCSSL